jgi:archaetidylinositol phosphate synthase
VLDRLRARLGVYLTGIGEVFDGVPVSPTFWTFVGFILSVAAGYAFYLSTGTFELLGGVLILVAGFFDIVDGAVARVSGRLSKRGAFLDSTLDRVAEVAIFVGLLGGAWTSPVLGLVVLSGSLLVSYTRAKGDALGVSLSGVGVGERSERLLVLALSSLVGLVAWGVIVVGIIAWLTFVERVVSASMKLPGAPPSPRQP